MVLPRAGRASAFLALVLSASGGACASAGPFALLGGSPPAAAPLRVQVEERFYPVSGMSAPALNTALAVAGPRRSGRAWHALTEWRVEWSYVPTRQGARCASGSPRVRVQIVTTLPRWLDLAEAPRSLASDWALFLSRLRSHEWGHQDLAVKGGSELLETLAGLEADDCQSLLEEAEEAVSRLASAYRDRHVRFDRSTRYGLRPERP